MPDITIDGIRVFLVHLGTLLLLIGLALLLAGRLTPVINIEQREKAFGSAIVALTIAVYALIIGLLIRLSTG
jgi:nitrate reductase gamma subunit